MKLRGFEIVSSYQNNGINLPQRKTSCSAGYDIEAAEDALLDPKTVSLIPTGLKAYMQSDEYLGIHIRSGLAVKQHLSLINGQGIIDADYYNNAANEGHIMIAVYNHTSSQIKIQKGDRIAQGIFYKYLRADQDHTEDSPIRTGGFGSTGK
jgi:dUTP pyrophosphatase